MCRPRLPTILIALMLLVLCSTSNVTATAGPQLEVAEKKLKDISSSLPSNSISLKEWEKINEQISTIIDSIKEPSKLADLALWCHYGAPREDQVKERFFVFVHARDACIHKISTLHTDSAKTAILKVKRNVWLDGGVGRIVGDSLNELGVNEKLRATFTFNVPEKLELMPLSWKDIQARSKIVQSFWSIWEKEGAKYWVDGTNAECKVRFGHKTELISLSISGRSGLKEADRQKLTNSIERMISRWKLPFSERALQDVDIEISLQ